MELNGSRSIYRPLQASTHHVRLMNE
uniref:Uncharacterized protein n=1 Tax=Arundo donax TaxID=35708 RepID=A0A0A8XT82_ARUDO